MDETHRADRARRRASVMRRLRLSAGRLLRAGARRLGPCLALVAAVMLAVPVSALACPSERAASACATQGGGCCCGDAAGDRDDRSCRVVRAAGCGCAKPTAPAPAGTERASIASPELVADTLATARSDQPSPSLAKPAGEPPTLLPPHVGLQLKQASVLLH